MVSINETAVTMPLLALRGLVVFPKNTASFDVARKKSANALKSAMESNRLLFVVTQKNFYAEEPERNDLYDIGCVVKVKQVLKVSDSILKVLVEGICRAEYKNFVNGKNFYTADVTECIEKPITNREVYKETHLRRIKNQFRKYAAVLPGLAPDFLMTVDNATDLGFISDYIAFNIPAPFDDKQYILEQISPVTRAKILYELLLKEREINEIDKKINEKTRAAIDENQREYYLREQIKVLSNELYGDETADEIDNYYAKINNLSAPDSVKEALASHVAKLSKMPQGSHEGTVERNYLDTCLELPWCAFTEVTADISRASKILDRDIYGMEKVKERILELLSVYVLNPDIKGQIICLVGPPGVGKTSIGKTIAECMGRRFARISLGGIHDEAEIRGHRKTYIGAMPGKIINAVKQSGSGNPLILLDEIEKAHPDVWNLLLQILEDGQLTDSHGRRVDFRNTVIVLTSNVGARQLTRRGGRLGFSAGEAEERMDRAVEEELRATFPPEFLNRIDDTVIFRRLEENELKEIARQMLAETAARIEEQGLTLCVEEDALICLAQRGGNSVYGARPLRRLIRTEVEEPLADGILAEEYRMGDNLLLCGEGDRLIVRKKQQK